MMKQNIIFIGFMGAGKTSVGTAYAQKHGCRLLDTDQLIETRAGMRISDIFAVQGEEAFRKTETKTLDALLEETKESAERCVISTGGGLPLREENRERLKKLGRVIYLRIQPETVIERLKGDTTRPLLAGDRPEEKVRELLSQRSALYEAGADIVVDVDGKSIRAIMAELEEQIGEQI